MAPNPFLPGPPGKKGDTTMILFLMFSFLTVMTPMCVFYLSYHRYLDGARPVDSGTRGNKHAEQLQV